MDHGSSSVPGERLTVHRIILSSLNPKIIIILYVGDIIYLNAAGQPTIVANSQKVATDLLDRRAGIYSDRPRNIVACDFMTKGLFMSLTRYGDLRVYLLNCVLHER